MVGQLGKQLLEKQILKIIVDILDKMVSILIIIIQHEQFYLIILLIGLKAATLLKKEIWHRYFPVNFVQFVGTAFFIELIWATAFGLSFVNP